MQTPFPFGVWVQERRKALGLTQIDLARLVGCSSQTIRKIEAQQRRPSLPMAERLARFLEIDSDALPAFLRAARQPLAPEPTTAAPAAVVPEVALGRPFLGREQELRELSAYLAEPERRLITLLGPGGVGKTTLAQQIAAAQAPRLAHGAAFVRLASLVDSNALIASIAAALGLNFCGDGEPAEQLLGHLRERELLLVLDNLEHLLPAADLLPTLIEQAPRLRVLATSRERLGLRDEWVYRLAGLDLPVSGHAADLSASSAAQLFLLHARRAHSGFVLNESSGAAVARICEALGGLPLAIELAASWARLLSCEEIAAEIGRGLDFLASPWRDLPERHRSIRAVLDQSWQMLGADEQCLLARCAIFRGAFDRAAATEVAGASLRDLLTLADKSLLLRTADGRYSLHELVRQYAEERLLADPAKAECVRDRHCAYYLGLLERHEAALKGHAQQAALDALSAEIDNLRAAWDRAIARRDAAALRRGVRGLSLLCDLRGWYDEGAEHFAAGLDALDALGASPAAPRDLRLARAQLITHYEWHAEGQHPMPYEQLHETLRELRQLDDPHALADLLLYFGIILQYEGRYDESHQLLTEGRERMQQLGDSWGVACALTYEGTLALVQGRPNDARALLEQSCTLSRAAGNLYGLARTLSYAAHASHLSGDVAAARLLLHEGIRLCGSIGDLFGIAGAYEMLGRIAFDQADYPAAQGFFLRSLDAFREIGSPGDVPLMHLGAVALRLGDLTAAERDLRATLNSTSPPIVLLALLYLAELQWRRGQATQALELALVVAEHPALPRSRLQQVNELRAELERHLPSEQVAAIAARARERTLDDLRRTLG